MMLLAAMDQVKLPEDSHEQSVRVLHHILAVIGKHLPHGYAFFDTDRLDHELPIMRVVEEAPTASFAHLDDSISPLNARLHI